MSEKQLHELTARLNLNRRCAARPCEMVARSESRRRTKVNLQAGCRSSVPSQPSDSPPNAVQTPFWSRFGRYSEKPKEKGLTHYCTQVL